MTEEKSHCKMSQNTAKKILTHILIFLIIQIHRVFDFMVDFLFGLYYNRMVQKVPPIRDELLLCSAVELAEKIKTKQVSVEKVVRTFIERAKEVNKIINAITEDRFEAALVEAKNADIFMSQSDSNWQLIQGKPFFGVPFTTKESNAVEGMLHTLGLLNRRQQRATVDAPVVARMKQAGGILIATTNVPEINLWQETRNNLYGQTLNPYDTTRTVGGSSGGEAAIVAACGSAISVAGDIGGSTRMPAFYNGLFGHKPTAGVLPMVGLGLRTEEIPESMVAAGPICKKAIDLEPALAVFAGNKAPLLSLGQKVNLDKLRVFYQEFSGELRSSTIDSAQRDALSRAVDHFRRLTGSAKKIRMPGSEYSYKLWRYWMTREKSDFKLDITNGRYHANATTELIRFLTGRSEFTLAAVAKLCEEQYFPKEDPHWAKQVTSALTEYLTDKLGDNGVLFYPSCPTTAGYHYSAFFKPYNFSYWCLFNVLRFPACQVPMGVDKNGHPVGIQVVAAPHNDNICIAVATELEKAFGGWVQPS